MDSLPSNSADALLAAVAELPEEQFAALKNYLKGPRPFDAHQSAVEQLAAQTGLPKKTLKAVLPMLGQIYGYANDDEEGAEHQIREVIFSLDHLPRDRERTDRVVARLADLLQKSEAIDRSRKIERVKRGFGNVARAFDTIVELRPALNADRSEVATLIPLIEVRIRSSSPHDSSKEYVFQTDETGLDKLQEAIDTAKAKIRTLRTNQALTDLIYREKP